MLRIDCHSGTSLACRASNWAVWVSTAQKYTVDAHPFFLARRLPEVDRPLLRAPCEVDVERRHFLVMRGERVGGDQPGTPVADHQIESTLGKTHVDVLHKDVPTRLQQIAWHESGHVTSGGGGSEILRVAGVEYPLSRERQRSGRL